MGGKKKSLANRLAKMSDEERARYMQHRSDVEEEARRRKEQLLTTFMKNKVKKEETFSRLNLAKINQQWHQILRQGKCKEMKESCEHTKKWVERVVALKNSTIDNLMKELDEAEFQYSNNLQAHLQHVDVMIDFHRQFLNQVHATYENDRDWLLDVSAAETRRYLENAGRELKHMKTLVFGQEVTGRSKIKEGHDYYLKKNAGYLKVCRSELEKQRRTKDAAGAAIWRDIAKVISGYVERTDRRRAQLAELRRLDAESAAEIGSNQERIDCEEAEIDKLRGEYATVTTTRKLTIQSLRETYDVASKKILAMRKNLQDDLKVDEDRLRFLTDASNRAINSMRELIRKGERIQQLVSDCSKYETNKEEVKKWAPWIDDISCSSISDPTDPAPVSKSRDDPFDDDTISSESLNKTSEISAEKIEDTNIYKIFMKQKYRPKTEIGRKILFGKKTRELFSPESSMGDMHVDGAKTSATKSASSLNGGKRYGILDEQIKSLSQLERTWTIYNAVNLDCVDLRKERKALKEENEALKSAIRNILENAVMEKNGLMDRYVCPRGRAAASAPPKLLKMKI